MFLGKGKEKYFQHCSSQPSLALRRSTLKRHRHLLMTTIFQLIMRMNRSDLVTLSLINLLCLLVFLLNLIEYNSQSEGFPGTPYASPCVRDWPGAGQRRRVCCCCSCCSCCCCSVALTTPCSCPQSDFLLNRLKPRPGSDPPNH